MTIIHSFGLVDKKMNVLLETHSIGKKNQKRVDLDSFSGAPLQRAIFWTAEEKYLISKPIDLSAFAANPEEASVPLRNCFLLAGISKISDRINRLQDDSTEVELLEVELGRKVTEHIQYVWPDHPIAITFKILDDQINFHVKDLGVQGIAKTADQRSDGFKQFISFLLTISAQNQNEELNSTVILLDEPETHLHPLAQEYLLGELVKITKNDRNNVCLFATHSNYMIDKEDISRNLRVLKPNEATEIRRFEGKRSTYACVTYEVFNIASSDYHSELYGKLHEIYQDEDENDADRSKVQNFDKKFFNARKNLQLTKPWKSNKNSATLPTYIRNCIHHPESGEKYSNKELRSSIEAMRKYL